MPATNPIQACVAAVNANPSALAWARLAASLMDDEERRVAETTSARVVSDVPPAMATVAGSSYHSEACLLEALKLDDKHPLAWVLLVRHNASTDRLVVIPDGRIIGLKESLSLAAAHGPSYGPLLVEVFGYMVWRYQPSYAVIEEMGSTPKQLAEQALEALDHPDIVYNSLEELYHALVSRTPCTFSYNEDIPKAEPQSAADADDEEVKKEEPKKTRVAEFTVVAEMGARVFDVAVARFPDRAGIWEKRARNFAPTVPLEERAFVLRGALQRQVTPNILAQAAEYAARAPAPLKVPKNASTSPDAALNDQEQQYDEYTRSDALRQAIRMAEDNLQNARNTGHGVAAAENDVATTWKLLADASTRSLTPIPEVPTAVECLRNALRIDSWNVELWLDMVKAMETMQYYGGAETMIEAILPKPHSLADTPSRRMTFQDVVAQTCALGGRTVLAISRFMPFADPHEPIVFGKVAVPKVDLCRGLVLWNGDAWSFIDLGDALDQTRPHVGSSPDPVVEILSDALTPHACFRQAVELAPRNGYALARLVDTSTTSELNIGGKVRSTIDVAEFAIGLQQTDSLCAASRSAAQCHMKAAFGRNPPKDGTVDEKRAEHLRKAWEHLLVAINSASAAQRAERCEALFLLSELCGEESGLQKEEAIIASFVPRGFRISVGRRGLLIRCLDEYVMVPIGQLRVSGCGSQQAWAALANLLAADPMETVRVRGLTYNHEQCLTQESGLMRMQTSTIIGLS